jgi:hypothetical protein
MSELIASTREAAAAVEELQHTIDGLHGKTVDLGVDVAAANAAAAMHELVGATDPVIAAYTRLSEAEQEVGHGQVLLDQALAATVRSSGEAAAGIDRAAGATDQAGAAATRAGFGFFGWVRAMNTARFALFDGVVPGIFGAISGLHLLVDAAAEVVAVVVPALIAVGAFALAAAPTVGDIVTHMKNLNTVTTATGQALYPMTGAFQKMADAVRPQVYQLFGEALNVATQKAGEFTRLAAQTGTVIDHLGTRLAQALSSGGFEVFMAHAVSDVAKLGDIVGNVGGILGNLLKTVPGYAQYMLNFADGVTRVGEAFTGSGIVQGAIHAGLAFHGAWIYTGLLATGITRLLTGFGRFPGILSLASGALGKGAAMFEKVAGEGNIATRALGTMSSKLSMMQDLPWGWITLVGAAVGVLAYKFITAKDAADQFISSFNTRLASAPLVQASADLASGINQMSGSMVSAHARVTSLSGAMQAYGHALAPIAPGLNDVNKGLTGWITRVPGLNEALGVLTGHLHGFVQATSSSGLAAATAVHDYSAYQREVGLLTQQSVTFHSRLGELSAAFGGVSQAMGILTAAGITSGQMMDRSGKAWAQIITQVNGTIAAYRAMGQAGGVLGADMNAMDIASSDQVSAMAKLNQAWDTTIGIVSGGQRAFIGFEQNIHSVGQAAKTAGASMTGLNSQSLNLRAAWQNAYTSGSQVVDALRMMISTSPQAAAQNRNLTQSVKDVIAQLGAEGSKSKATRAEMVSLAQEVNPAIHNFSQLKTWLGNTGNAAQDLQKRLANMGVNIQDVARDAAALSSTMNSQLTSSFSAAKMQANGTQTAIQNLAKAVGTNASAAQQSQAKLTLFNDLVHKDGMTAQQAAALISALTGQIFKIPTGHHTNITTNSAQVRAEVAAVQASINSLHGVTVTNTVITQYITAGTRDVGQGGHQIFHQHGGIIPGYMPGHDTVPAMLSPGEAVLNPYAVRMLGAGFIHWANTIAERGGFSGGGGGGGGAVNPVALRAGVSGVGGGAGGAAVIHNHIILDGREIATAVRREQWRWETRSSGVRSGLNIPGTRIG